MSNIASNFSDDEEVQKELSEMIKEKDADARIKFLQEQRELEVTVDKDPNLMHISVTIASKDGMSYKVTANSTMMALSKCYASYLEKSKQSA
jgi:hypothetical protein